MDWHVVLMQSQIHPFINPLNPDNFPQPESKFSVVFLINGATFECPLNHDNDVVF